MQEKGNRLHLRLSDRDEENLQSIIEWSGANSTDGWNRSEAMRFCLHFTFILLSIMPATIIDAILSEQTKSQDEE